MKQRANENLKDLSNEKIETERLVLISVTLDFAQQMYDELTEEITKYLSFYPPSSVEDELNFIKKSQSEIKKGTNLVLMVLNKNTKEYLGNISINGLDTKTPEMGLWIKKSSHGKKIGREAAIGLKKWVDENNKYDYILYTAHKDNVPSIKIAESLGGVFIKSGLRTFPSGKVHDNVFYHIFSR